jgi:uncharacterized membrane protein YdjX (TVP38/TMEM64 family)
MKRKNKIKKKNGFYISKYPKLYLLIFTIIFACFIFYEGKHFAPFHDFLISLGYLGIFISGFFYAYAFTAAPATTILLVLAKEYNILFAVLIGGLGALLSDYLIFKIVRYSFIDEINNLKKEHFMKTINKKEKKLFGHYYKHIFPAFAGILIASPLPTEIGVTMMASMKKISVKKFMIIAYLLHSFGIFIILTIGNFI